MKKRYVYEVSYFLLAIVALLMLFDKERRFWILDYAIYGVFIIDYVVHFIKADKKWRYLMCHPLELMVILPISSGVRIIRLFRLFKLLQINTRFYKKFPRLSQVLTSNNVGLMVLWLLAVAMLVSVPLTFIEPNMKAYSDALWWTLVTTTTVGYGDIVPKTLFGRLIGMVLMLGGIGVVSLIIGNISHALTNKGSNNISQVPMTLSKFEQLGDEAKSRIVKRIEDEIELELYKQRK